jgi:hypothetical protein
MGSTSCRRLVQCCAGGVQVKNRPELPGKVCAGSDKRMSERIEAIAVVGMSIELATSLKAGIEALSGAGRPPVAPHRPGFDPDAWRTLAAYLIEERRLIEFLLGPSVVGNQEGNLRYRNPDDICVDCFRPDDGRHWRFRDDEVRTELQDRAGRINKRLTHFSWTLTRPDTRLDAGIWNTKYLNQVIDGLERWSEWLETMGLFVFAETLRRSTNPNVRGRRDWS